MSAAEMINLHGDTLPAGSCGVLWGTMAPPGGGPGVLHACRCRAEWPASPSEPERKHEQHDGLHECACGELAVCDSLTRVVCQYPAKPRAVPCPHTGCADWGTGRVHAHVTKVCGATVTGIEKVDYRARRRLLQGGGVVRAGTLLSIPCEHPTRRLPS